MKKIRNGARREARRETRRRIGMSSRRLGKGTGEKQIEKQGVF